MRPFIPETDIAKGTTKGQPQLGFPLAFLRLTINASLADRLDILAGRHGGLVAALQFLVDQQASYETETGEDIAPSEAPVLAGSTIETHRKPPRLPDVTVQLRRGDLERLNEECEKARMTRSQWISALVRHRLGNLAQFCPGDRRTLQGLLLKFSALDRRLESITRTLNRPDVNIDKLPVGLGEVKDLRGRLQTTADELRDILHANGSYWEGNPDPSEPV
jgi:hypothetical protein